MLCYDSRLFIRTFVPHTTDKIHPIGIISSYTSFETILCNNCPRRQLLSTTTTTDVLTTGTNAFTAEEHMPPQSYTCHNEMNSGKLTAGVSIEGGIVSPGPKNDYKRNSAGNRASLDNAGDNG